MAKNRDVVEAFFRGESHPKTTNLKIDGDRLINYYTVLAERRVTDDGELEFVLNETRYSNSTSRIQHCIRMEAMYRNHTKVFDKPMGISRLFQEQNITT